MGIETRAGSGQLVTGPFPSGRGPRAFVAVFVLALVVTAAVGIVVVSNRGRSGLFHFTYANPPYQAQPDRSAEWLGSQSGTMTGAQLGSLATGVGYEVIPKFAAQFNITDHFNEARRLVDESAAHGNHIRVFEYYNASFWLLVNNASWGRYARGFDTSWYLRDASGNPIPYYGTRRSAKTSTPIGYVLDLANPDYRAWAVHTILSWMRQAPYAGVAFDSANMLSGEKSRAPVGDGSSYNSLLCGPVGGTCSRVDAWNSGLASLLSETSAALHRIGDQVVYNGIAPSDARGPQRNLQLLDDADMAANEGFCYTAATSGSRLSFNSLAADATIMQDAARQGKKILEITNYRAAPNERYGNYCLAGFLLGWQPGYDYWVYHRDYATTNLQAGRVTPEQQLALGNPATATFQQSGSVLTRQFAHGMVAVNDGSAPATFRVPVAMVRFDNGTQTATYAPGQRVSLPPRSAALLLTREYLYART